MTATADDQRISFRDWPTAGRWAVYVVVAVVLALVVALVAAVVVVRRSFPETDGTLHLAGLAHPVDVRRDGHGIAQVYADTSADLFYAQGFVQAQDRFWEMDFRRHVTAGRLSELLGKATVETDLYLRALGWRRVAKQELALLSPETRRYLDSYSAGVNAYISSHSVTQMSLEYSVLGLNGLDYKPEKWTPVDSLAWLKAMAWDLRGNMDDEIDRARLSVSHTRTEIAALYPGYPYDDHAPIMQTPATPAATATPRARPPVAAQLKALDAVQRGVDAIPELIGTGDGIGSNSWVVAGRHTKSGQPLLANDPHLGQSEPGVWYQMGLHCRQLSDDCPFDVSGFTFAGVPGVVIGHNQRISWGFTNLDPDVTDLYLEKLDGQRYLYNGAWHPLVERDEVIKVAGSTPITITVRSTRHGPLLSDVSAELSSVGANATVPARSPDRGNGYAVALSWTALTPSRTADALFMIDTATDWASFREAAARFAVPSQNLVYADVDGNIGYQAPGMIPIRKGGRHGDYPVAGWLPRNDWSGKYVPFSALPHELNPAEGFIVTANQAVTGPGYRYYLGDSWDRGYRSERIRELLTQAFEKGRVGVDDMTRIQNDTANPMAPELVPYLERIPMPNKYYGGGKAQLHDWDFQQPADSASAAYFNVVWSNLLRLTFHDQLRESLWPDGGQRWMGVVTALLRDPNNAWWDDVNTDDVVETRDQILLEAMKDSRDELVRRISLDPAKWEWGRLHRLELENQSLGQSDIGAVAALFNRGPYRVGGGFSAVDATSWNASKSYDVTAAPSMRMVVDLADFDHSRWINLTGVSGHAFSSHYTDQTELWRAGKTLPWAFSDKDVKAATDDTLRLVPTTRR